MEYLDFEVAIGQGSGREYPVAVDSPAGEAQETMHFPFDELELEGRLKDLQIALLRSGGRRRRVLSREEQAVQAFGQALFDALFSGEVRNLYGVSQERAFQEGKGLRLKLRIEPAELATLPWEFLYDRREGEYLCLARSTPVVRYLPLPRPVRPLTVRAPLRILGMVASPIDQEPLEVDREKRRVERALQDLQAEGRVELTWLEGETWRHLQRAMRGGPWHVFHFIGHGGFDRGRDEGFFALADENGETQRLMATQLGRLLANQGSIRLVLLNSCEGAAGGTQDIFSSSAAILVRRGIPAVLAMQYEITDRAAVELARTFYEALADGLPVDAAVVEARAAISVTVSNSVEWGTPVLYMRTPDGALFGMEERAASGERGARAQREEPARVERVSVPTREKAAAPETPIQADLTKLRQLLAQRFSLSELHSLCFDLEVDYDDLPGNSKADKARELVAYLDRRGRVAELVALGRQQRPDVPWGEALGVLRGRDREPERVAARKPFEPELILIPEGEFLLGSDPKRDARASSDEQPQHPLDLPAYYLAKTPVTNAQYAAFVEATGQRQPKHWQGGRIPSGKEKHPVVNVSWHDAVAYCKWLAEITGRPYRLPSEAEWEKGARGTQGWIYPWGNEWDPERCNSSEKGPGDTTPVGAYPQGASPYGLLDMAGNVWEWTSSLYRDYPYRADDGREDLSAEGGRVLRGGAFYFDERYVRCAYRDHYDPYYLYRHGGVRVAAAPFSLSPLASDTRTSGALEI